MFQAKYKAESHTYKYNFDGNSSSVQPIFMTMMLIYFLQINFYFYLLHSHIKYASDELLLVPKILLGCLAR